MATSARLLGLCSNGEGSLRGVCDQGPHTHLSIRNRWLTLLQGVDTAVNHPIKYCSGVVRCACCTGLWGPISDTIVRVLPAEDEVSEASDSRSGDSNVYGAYITKRMPYHHFGSKASLFQVGAGCVDVLNMKEPNSAEKVRIIFKPCSRHLSPLDIHHPLPSLPSAHRRSRRPRWLTHSSSAATPEAYAPPLHLAAGTSSRGVS